MAAPLYFYPTDSWNIEQNQQNCRITNTYNNGFIFSLVGAKNSPQTYPVDLNINFQQAAFAPSTSYKTTIQFDTPAPAVTLDATAIDAQTLSLPVSKHANMMRNLMNAPSVNIIVGGNNFNFSLVGLKQHKDDFKMCLNASYRPVAEPVMPETIAYGETQVVPTSRIDHVIAPPSMQGQSEAAMNTPRSLISPPSRKPGMAQTMPIDEWGAMQDNSTADDLPEMMNHNTSMLNHKDWNLEKATMRYQEAERQLKSMGQKLQRERTQCKLDKKELESLLFDPQLTEDRQLATLNSLEDELERTKEKMKNMEMHYQERVRILEQQLNSF